MNDEITIEGFYDDRSIGNGLSVFAECVEDDTGNVRWRRRVNITFAEEDEQSSRIAELEAELADLNSRQCPWCKWSIPAVDGEYGAIECTNPELRPLTEALYFNTDFGCARWDERGRT